MTSTLKLAVQKSGRLSDDSMTLLSDCDFRFPLGKSSRTIRSKALNFPLEILLVRDDDIPQYVADGVVDLAILGDNVRIESESELKVLEKLDFGHCRLALAVPTHSKITSIADLKGKKIATSYPHSTSRYLSENGITAEIHVIKGSVEIAPSLGLADAITDLVGTGSTLILNGLREVDTIYSSQAVLISKPSLNPEVTSVLERFLFRVRAVEKGRNLKYLLLNVEVNNLQNVVKLLPGLRSPTIVPLSESSWNAVHSVVSEHNIWDLIEQLKAAGAEGIIVSPIEKMLS